MVTLKPISRRHLLGAGAAFAATSAVPALRSANADTSLAPIRLHATPGQASLLPAQYGITRIWGYNGTVPGPEIRIRQGEKVRALVLNGLAEETTIHWHGIRTPNAMDGVPHLTQQPIAAGNEFLYEFEAHDAGTFWYHPHQQSSEQVGRGLYGPLIVEEADPMRVDRDLTWVIDDWRMTGDGQVSNDFGNRHDAAHGGRIGNTVTINGVVPDKIPLRSGERLRLRLINAANARIFGLDFTMLNPVIVAMDGQPVSPHAPQNDVVVIGPAMRLDLVLDLHARPGSIHPINDIFYQGREYRLVDLVFDAEKTRGSVPDWPMHLPPNPMPEPDLSTATRHRIVFNGGMMGQMMMGPNRDSMIGQMHEGKIWFINGQAATGHVLDPMLALPLNSSNIFELENQTAWHHPIHLHGHSFRVLSRNGAATAHREWQDTVLMAPRERVEIAFVADNPGDWMFHCHIFEHQAAGMMGVIRVGATPTKT